jgi:hypothetical protein
MRAGAMPGRLTQRRKGGEEVEGKTVGQEDL